MPVPDKTVFLRYNTDDTTSSGMGESRMQKNRRNLPWADGLKGIACLLIMFGHYTGLYRYASDPGQIDSAVFHALPSFLGIFTAETFWLRLFFVLSGYLVAMSDIPSLKALFRKCILRFLRLALPLLGAALCILLLSKAVGFKNSAIQNLVPNGWIGIYYLEELTLPGALLEPFRVLLLGVCAFNGVWWVLRDMFLASLEVYLLTFLRGRQALLTDLLHAVLLLFFLLSGADPYHIHFSVLAGALLGRYAPWIEKNLNRLPSMFRTCLCLLLLCIPLIAFPFSLACVHDLAFLCLVCAVPSLPSVSRVMGQLACLGRLSFGIYSLHWPLFCSIGLTLLMKFAGHMSGAAAYVLAMLVSAALTVLLSVLYHVSVERFSGHLCKKADKAIKGLLHEKKGDSRSAASPSVSN